MGAAVRARGGLNATGPASPSRGRLPTLRAVQDRILIGRNGSVLQKLLQVESSGLPGRHRC